MPDCSPRRTFIVRVCFRIDACSEEEAEQILRNDLCRPNESTMDSVMARALPDVREAPPYEWPGEPEHVMPDVDCAHECPSCGKG